MRSRLGSTLGTAVFLVVGPGAVAGYVPWLFSRWTFQEPLLGWSGTRWVGVAAILLGLPMLLESFARFARVGLGTPAPVAPPERLVVSGFYRRVRNPMYVALVLMVLGQGLLFGNTALLIYAACLLAGSHFLVLVYEEPKLRDRFGAEYLAYCRAVPRWWPRLSPFTPVP